jgi:aarF domain-containing kinase
LGLIDYGQVKKLTKEQRIELAKLIVFISDEDVENTVEQFVKMGFTTKNMNPYILWASAVVFFDRDDREFTQGLNLQMFIEGNVPTTPSSSPTLPSSFVQFPRTELEGPLRNDG